MPEKILLLLSIALILSIHYAATVAAIADGPDTILLVDFGATAEDNTYGTAGWGAAFTMTIRGAQA